MASARTLAYMRLGNVPGIGPVLARRVLEALGGSPEAVFRASPASLAAIDGIGTMRVKNFASAPSMADVQMEVVRADAAGIKILTPEDPTWPPGLTNIPDPPIVLYVRGEILPHDALAIGVVGSRKCTHYGREQSERFGAMLAQAGMTVISGGARGIDTGAHEGALRAGGRTIAVMGCGLLNVYPPENEKLFDRIVNEGRGAIISELPLNAEPLADNFPKRNRIITAMSLGILVVEAGMKSGSLITARLAVDDYNREVFAIPGRVDSPVSAGTNNLIKTGRAKLVENVQDILDSLGEVGEELSKSLPAAPGQDAPKNRQAPPIAAQPAATRVAVTADPDDDEAPLFAEPAPEPAPAAKPVAAAPTKPGFTQAQQRILSALADGDALHVDLICERASLAAAVVMAELTMLQIRGAIKRLPGNKFAKK